MSKIKIDRDQIARHLSTLLSNAPKGTVVRLCAFPEKDEDGTPRIRRIKFTGNVGAVVTEALGLARWAAQQASRYVICVPAATFTGEGGKEIDVAAGLALSVDLDKHPARARKRLERVLGPPTLCIESGGYWGRGEKREATLHLYWLLRRAATGSALRLLKKAQRLAAEYAGADRTAISFAHAFRCAGTLHRKGKATVTRIASRKPGVQIDLRWAVNQLASKSMSATGTSSPAKPPREAVEAVRRGHSSAIKAVLRGNDYHASLTSLAMHYALAGMSKTSIEETLRSFMDGVPAKVRDVKEGKSEPGRWSRRVAAIPAIVKSAVEKVANSEAWHEPAPLPVSLPPVPALQPQMLPARLRRWLTDNATRMQAPVDYIAVSAITAAGSIVGRKVGMQPKPFDPSWIEVANQYSCVIGRPGIMKSPCMRKGLAPLQALEARAAKANEAADLKHKRELEIYQMRKKAAEPAVKKALKENLEADVSRLIIEPPAPPAHKRYIVHDALYESLGKILADNPSGALVYRDELAPFLTKLEDSKHSDLRGLLLSGWSGRETHSSDRIGRGHVGGNPHCVSLLGSSQPARFAAYVRNVLAGRSLDDGMLQRFGLLIYPDEPKTWTDVRISIDDALEKGVRATFKRLDRLDGASVGATRVIDGVPVLGFDKEAQKHFDVWHAKLERRLRSADLPEPLVGHLSKYRKVIPGLALIFHLIDVGHGPVGFPALKRALAWAVYLEAHARRAYHGVLQRHVEAAHSILDLIHERKLTSPFTERHLNRMERAGLADAKVIKAALQLLWDHHAVRRRKQGKTYVFDINPQLMRGAVRKG